MCRLCNFWIPELQYLNYMCVNAFWIQPTNVDRCNKQQMGLINCHGNWNKNRKLRPYKEGETEQNSAQSVGNDQWYQYCCFSSDLGLFLRCTGLSLTHGPSRWRVSYRRSTCSNGLARKQIHSAVSTAPDLHIRIDIDLCSIYSHALKLKEKSTLNESDATVL